jgi:bifunctional non-homologous end joining protein LigD
MATTTLRDYRRKRDFARTPEPAGDVAAHGTGGRSFVVQKHAASRLHYDFRLEHDGVLKSWAVPKGPSLDPSDRRLAMQTEDHPVEYGDFEGVIPRGEYGGGTVLLWDHGTWTPLDDPDAALRKGRLRFELHGRKLRGRWNLVRLQGAAARDRDRSWMLIKGRDGEARTRGDLASERPESVATGRGLDEIAAAQDRVWHSNRRTGRDDGAAAASPTPKVRAAPRATRATEPGAIEIAGVRLTHSDRVLYPGQGITKRTLAGFYGAIAEWILPHLADRPTTLVRCPEGLREPCFYQKHIGYWAPPSVRRVRIQEKRKVGEYLVVDDLPALIGLVQIGILEIHTWNSRVEALERPDRVVFDLDPADDVPWDAVVIAARLVRERLESLGLESFVKTTGGKGLHVVAPLVPEAGWDACAAFARDVAEALAREAPHAFVATMSKARRHGRIFVDHFRNVRGSTSVAAYSTRARPGAPVSTPLTWEELTPRVRSDRYAVANLRRRLTSLRADPWARYRTLRQRLPAGAAPATAARRRG